MSLLHFSPCEGLSGVTFAFECLALASVNVTALSKHVYNKYRTGLWQVCMLVTSEQALQQ